MVSPKQSCARLFAILPRGTPTHIDAGDPPWSVASAASTSRPRDIRATQGHQREADQMEHPKQREYPPFEHSPGALLVPRSSLRFCQERVEFGSVQNPSRTDDRANAPNIRNVVKRISIE